VTTGQLRSEKNESLIFIFIQLCTGLRRQHGSGPFAGLALAAQVASHRGDKPKDKMGGGVQAELPALPPSRAASGSPAAPREQPAHPLPPAAIRS